MYVSIKITLGGSIGVEEQKLATYLSNFDDNLYKNFRKVGI